MDTICKLCDGTGIVQIHNTTYKFYWCPKCKGTGFFTWIDEIFGIDIYFEANTMRRDKNAKIYRTLSSEEKDILFNKITHSIWNEFSTAELT